MTSSRVEAECIFRGDHSLASVGTTRKTVHRTKPRYVDHKTTLLATEVPVGWCFFDFRVFGSGNPTGPPTYGLGLFSASDATVFALRKHSTAATGHPHRSPPSLAPQVLLAATDLEEADDPTFPAGCFTPVPESSQVLGRSTPQLRVDPNTSLTSCP